MRFWRSHLLIACAASTATAIVVGGIAFATIPNNLDGTVSACYKTSAPDKGQMRMIDHQAGRACRGGETMLNWPTRGFRWRGEWNGAAAYKKNDVVSFNGSSYIALTNTTNVLPVSRRLLGAHGRRGHRHGNDGRDRAHGRDRRDRRRGVRRLPARRDRPVRLRLHGRVHRQPDLHEREPHERELHRRQPRSRCDRPGQRDASPASSGAATTCPDGTTSSTKHAGELHRPPRPTRFVSRCRTRARSAPARRSRARRPVRAARTRRRARRRLRVAVASEHSTSPGPARSTMRAARLTSRPTMSSPRRRGQPQCTPMRTHIGSSPSDSRSNASLEREARVDRLARVVEPEQQPVAELLHDARRLGQRRAHQLLLPFEERRARRRRRARR